MPWKYTRVNRLYPDLQRRGLAKVIDSHMERAEKTLDDFKHKDFPRVAISVDMLDTGIDVPSIRNLVFAKPVFSKVKFWQMVGRGTRKWTDPVSGEVKHDFLIIDHWDNFAYFQVNNDGRTGLSYRTTSHEIVPGPFREAANTAAEKTAADVTRASLQEMLGSLPLENVNIAPHAEELRSLASDDSAGSSRRE